MDRQGCAVATTPRRDLEVGGRGLRRGRVRPRTVPNPRRWDLATPNRYLARTTIRQGEQIVDRLRPALWLPHDRVHTPRRLQAQRPPGSSEWHVQPSRSRPARRGVERPRAGAAARDPQGDGLQRAADLAQPARARAARPGRSHGLRGDGRGLRLLEARQDRPAITAGSSTSGTPGTCRRWSAASGTIPA